ncbi:hypothetical protein Tco_1329326 [Tanacetum coccineum]
MTFYTSPMVTDALTEGQTGVNMPRMKLDSDQGLPRHIFNILNQTNTAKEIWDNVEMLMQGSVGLYSKGSEDIFDDTNDICAIGKRTNS